MKIKPDPHVNHTWQQFARYYARYGEGYHPISKLERLWWPALRWASSVHIYFKDGIAHATTTNQPPEWKLPKQRKHQ